MNLLVAFALLAVTALSIFVYSCQRISRRREMRAARMMRCLDLAIRAEAELVAAGVQSGDTR
jgi:hypothetical protein